MERPIQITVGFEIDYIDYSDINVINEENNEINCENNISMGALYETLTLMRHFLVYKQTNIVHVMINICSGIFFVIGESEMEERIKGYYLSIKNSRILYKTRFNKIELDKIKDVRPIFKYNKKDLRFANININGNVLGNNQLNNI